MVDITTNHNKNYFPSNITLNTVMTITNYNEYRCIGLRWLRHFQRYFSYIVAILLVEEIVVHGEIYRVLVYDSHNTYTLE